MRRVNTKKLATKVILAITGAVALVLVLYILPILLHPPYPPGSERERLSAWHDLMSLTLAMTLSEMDHDREIASLKELTQGPSPYLGEIPLDQCANREKAYLVLKGAKGQIAYVYSVGPDEDDDQCRIRYDPTNGVVSNGDIFAERRDGVWTLPWWGERWQERDLANYALKEVGVTLSPDRRFIIAPRRQGS